MYGHTVRIGSGFELVAQAQLKVTLMPEVRIIQLTDFLCALFDEHALFKVEQIRCFTADLFPPAIKVTRRNHVMADALVVELKHRFVIDENVAAARFMLQLFDFIAQFQVVAEEGVTSLPVALHQRVADKQLAAQRRINLAVIHLTGRNNR